eukprot:TRINITY_DN71340_c0_g1_i1.p3 TRINITY_DN71340_c0_g1~~TRINITY_DN71340_c0_g1_i1.p3  ORF type:complete len:140 (+),score=16.42 TRINITY_DN71340_c0_g1_i1:313-732(+)
MKAVVHSRTNSDNNNYQCNNRNVVGLSVISCVPFVLIMCILGLMGNLVEGQRTSVQLLENLEVVIGVGVLHTHDAQDRASVLRRRHLQQYTNKECTQVQLDWLSNALVGQCNVTNPRQLQNFKKKKQKKEKKHTNNQKK